MGALGDEKDSLRDGGHDRVGGYGVDVFSRLISSVDASEGVGVAGIESGTSAIPLNNTDLKNTIYVSKLQD